MKKDKEGVKAGLSTHRVITKLDRREIDFLDKLGKDALFTTGHKLSYNEILRGLIDFAMVSGISGDNIDSTLTLKAKLQQWSRQNSS
ncbi:MAG: hypothetical protein PHG40_00790 [Candidatus Omnitrophica bacterium]|nr:hypothetical protein [Candidatus Omnitrophota bacterium]